MNQASNPDLSDLAIVNRFAVSLLQQNSLDDLLWSMATNLGEVLGFEDCVIYLLQGNHLVQKAAYGVKNPDSRNIKNEITIPLGQGIVGCVGQSGKAENIGDLSGDARYIQDEFSGHSELAVPLIADGQVIGVLDSESSHVNGFDQRDQNMLESLANIAAPRISSAIAQIEKEKAEQAMLQAKLEAEQANQAKSEFLSRMSHELKTPLNAILGFANLIKIRAGSKADPQIDKILQSGEHLLRLINESLDILSAERNEITLEFSRVDIAEVVTDCFAMLEQGAIDRKIQLKFAVSELWVETDSQRLRQVVLNLVSNAIKYNREQGEVIISIHQKDDKAQIIVEDTGIGMTLDEQKQLFRPFTRFGARQDAVEGHGMGLSITHQIITVMGGQIEVDSEPGRGTRFTVTIPGSRSISTDKISA
ncbi:MAG: ATP-binding protein [Pseudomonadota bacterium]